MEGPAAAQKHTEISDFFILLNRPYISPYIPQYSTKNRRACRGGFYFPILGH